MESLILLNHLLAVWDLVVLKIYDVQGSLL